MSFEFVTATRIVFGEGALRQVAPAAIPWGRRVLVVSRRDSAHADRLRADLQAGGAASNARIKLSRISMITLTARRSCRAVAA